jgi:hypothetical protein
MVEEHATTRIHRREDPDEQKIFPLACMKAIALT